MKLAEPLPTTYRDQLQSERWPRTACGWAILISGLVSWACIIGAVYGLYLLARGV